MGRSNKNIIDEYFQNLCSEKQYSFAEAKKLYERILNNTNEKERIKLREGLLCGTLGLLKKYIKKSLLGVLNNNVMSLEDVLSDCVEIYISLVDSGVLLEVRTFSALFNHILLYRFTEKYGKNILNTDIYKKYFMDVLNWYSKESQLGIDIKYEDFYKVWKNIINNDYVLYKMYLLTNDIYKVIYDNDIKLSSYDLEVLKKLIIYINYEKYIYSDNYDDGSYKCIDSVENTIIENEIRDCLSVLTDKQLEVIKNYYGFEDAEKTFEELAADFGVTKGCINNSIKISHKKLIKFRGKRLKQLRLIYDGSKSE